MLSRELQNRAFERGAKLQVTVLRFTKSLSRLRSASISILATTMAEGGSTESLPMPGMEDFGFVEK